MKSKNLILSAILMAVSSTVMAQENIQKAFDALKQSKGQEETYTNHFLEKDPETGLMEGMSDEYEFKITDAANKHLITAIRQAFNKDEQAAYSVSTGSHGGAESYTSLAVGNGNKGGIAIGLMNDSKWIYACFLDPDDTLRIHRYAYALEWVEKKDGSITGRIVKTYATTQKYRQKKTTSSFVINGKKIDLSGGLGTLNATLGRNDSEIWINSFNNLRTLFMKKSEGTAANSWVTQIYGLCNSAGSLDEAEKNMVIKEIQKLKTKTNDEFIKELFDMSIERLKK
jgi:hypothetical protein